MTVDSLPATRGTAAFERRVARALEAVVAKDAPLLVACSGGPDSTAALIAISRSRGPDDGAVVAAHFNHELRPAAATALDGAAVDAVAALLGRRVLHGAAADVGGLAGGSEAAAREARYGWLAEACAESGARHCATGHTLDDQAETVLLRLTRGAGTAGAAAMSAAARWPVPCEGPELQVLRPLLGVRRQETHDYLDTLGVESRLDATNELVAFDRNRVRHRVLPELRAINPRAEEALARFAALARDDDEALEAWAAREAVEIAVVEAGVALVQRRALLNLPRAVSSRLLRRAAADAGLTLDGEQVAQLLRLARRRGARLSLAGGEAVVGEGELRIVRFP